MNLDKLKELEDLKVELTKLEEETHKLFNENTEPAIMEKCLEFIHSFGEFFREKGFTINMIREKVTAEYNSLTFTAEIKNRQIYIRQGGKEVNRVVVNYNPYPDSDYFTPLSDPFQAEKVRIQNEIERVGMIKNGCMNPVFTFSPLKDKRIFKTPIELLSEIFK